MTAHLFRADPVWGGGRYRPRRFRARRRLHCHLHPYADWRHAAPVASDRSARPDV